MFLGSIGFHKELALEAQAKALFHSFEDVVDLFLRNPPFLVLSASLLQLHAIRKNGIEFALELVEVWGLLFTIGLLPDNDGINERAGDGGFDLLFFESGFDLLCLKGVRDSMHSEDIKRVRPQRTLCQVRSGSLNFLSDLSSFHTIF